MMNNKWGASPLLETKGNNMSVQTITINGIDLDVYYTCEKCRDAYGTGDSPTLYDIDIRSVELTGDTTNIWSILSSSIIEDIENEIFSIEGK